MLDKLIEGVLRFLEATYNAWSDQWDARQHAAELLRDPLAMEILNREDDSELVEVARPDDDA